MAEAPGAELGEPPGAAGILFCWAPLVRDGAMPAVWGRSDNHVCWAGSRCSRVTTLLLNVAQSCGESLRWLFLNISWSVSVGLQSHGLHQAWNHSPAPPLVALM